MMTFVVLDFETRVHRTVYPLADDRRAIALTVGSAAVSASPDALELPCVRSNLVCRSNDGVEPKCGFLRCLEGRVCKTCAPGDQRKSKELQRDRDTGPQLTR